MATSSAREWRGSCTAITLCPAFCRIGITLLHIDPSAQRLPLTKDDIEIIAKKMGYLSKAEFIRTETRISSWEQQEAFGNVIT
ncbi:MAG: hypothetical protein WA667_01875, partial [Candidatus Nitrosopolaris sp.]